MGLSSTGDYMWTVYQLFHNPPGSPKELKCVGCKIASGFGFTAVSIVMFVKAKRMFVRNNTLSSIFGLSGCLTTGASVVMFRMASDHSHYNEELTKQRQLAIKNERKQKRDEIQGLPKTGQTPI